jgi:hypothetical protein
MLAGLSGSFLKISALESPVLLLQAMSTVKNKMQVYEIVFFMYVRV